MKYGIQWDSKDNGSIQYLKYSNISIHDTTIYKNIYIKEHKVPYKISNSKHSEKVTQYDEFEILEDGKMFIMKISDLEKTDKFKIRKIEME